MKVMSADQMMTKMAARNCSHSWWKLPVYIRPFTEKGTQLLVVARYFAFEVLMTCPAVLSVPHPYSTMPGSANTPRNRPPKNPAMPWV